MMQVKKNAVVTIRYIMQNSRGDVLENTMDGPSASYLHGSSGILKTLQSQLEDLQTGERKRVFLFREHDAPGDDFIFDVLIEKIREGLPQELALGYPLTGVPVECAPGCTCYY
jgi:hypothetical protein